jgi:hypothetical protein
MYDNLVDLAFFLLILILFIEKNYGLKIFTYGFNMLVLTFFTKSTLLIMALMRIFLKKRLLELNAPLDTSPRLRGVLIAL